MSLLQDVLEFNKKFVEEKKYELYETSKFPNKKMVILSCMDTRLVELLPHALNLRNGDVKIVKNAGALVSHPFGSIMRSILVAVYELQADEVCVIGHHDCGAGKLQAEPFLEKVRAKGISDEVINTIEYSMDLKKWLTGFDSVEETVQHSVETIRNHPLFSKDTPVHGLVIDPNTGKLDVVVNGYEAIENN
ncbi:MULTISPECIES: beta-class carbonic anhydrase [Priestia]|uniref:carbonic anhydrase n=3 Tax=Priestia TaxID=2800373 RepID=A0AAX6BRH4_PRIMG|nr:MULTISPECIES: carbonic anhydrase [Priestia]MBK0292652.1 carbonic anhydrase [Bacillus sp. S34]MBU8850370.1 carbonic anhydrase [Bacillus sp. FJAT-26377]MCL9637073.1 carbonic anhydrase [Bacillus zanthoxyli]NHH91891.1 Carbonic anhydrase 1 [Bacillus sp. MB95]UPK50405.1 carbonic anhydrase [Bacillus sp. H8-1]